MPLVPRGVKSLFFAEVVDENTCLIYKTLMPFAPTSHRSLVAIMTVLCLVHGVFLSWKHMQDNWATGQTAGALVLTMSEAQVAKTYVPPKPKKTVTQTLPVTESAPERAEVQETATSPVAQMAAMDLKQMYLAELRAMIERNKVYPVQASRLGQTGVVEVSFTLTADGHIIDSRISRPCPFQRLNEAALVAVNTLGHFRPIPSELGGNPIEVKIPIRYSLYK